MTGLLSPWGDGSHLEHSVEFSEHPGTPVCRVSQTQPFKLCILRPHLQPLLASVSSHKVEMILVLYWGWYAKCITQCQTQKCSTNGSHLFLLLSLSFSSAISLSSLILSPSVENWPGCFHYYSFSIVMLCRLSCCMTESARHFAEIRVWRCGESC